MYLPTLYSVSLSSAASFDMSNYICIYKCQNGVSRPIADPTLCHCPKWSEEGVKNYIYYIQSPAEYCMRQLLMYTASGLNALYPLSLPYRPREQHMDSLKMDESVVQRS
jgi:hypothetical protein